jgi:hypothetical protein
VNLIGEVLSSTPPSAGVVYPPLHPVGPPFPIYKDMSLFQPPPWPIESRPETPENVRIQPPPPKTPGFAKALQLHHPPTEAKSVWDIDDDMDIDAFVTETVDKLDRGGVDLGNPRPLLMATQSTPTGTV